MIPQNCPHLVACNSARDQLTWEPALRHPQTRLRTDKELDGEQSRKLESVPCFGEE